MKKIVFANNKGGVLKTTLVTNLAGVLVKNNKKVLILDTDPQGMAIGRFGRNADQEKNSLSDFLVGASNFDDCLKWVYQNKIALITSSFELNLLEAMISKNQIKGEQIKKKIKEIFIKAEKMGFDYLLIDTAPTFNRITNLVFSLTDQIIIPTALEQDSFKGVTTMINIAKNDGLIQKISFVIPTLVKKRVILHKNLLEQWLLPLLEQNKIKSTKNIIYDSIRVSTTTAIERIPITLTNSNSEAKKVYFNLANEIFKKGIM